MLKMLLLQICCVVFVSLNSLVSCADDVTNICRHADHPDGEYAHPTDCSKFIQCNSGDTFILDCPSGKVYNDDKLLCDDRENVPRCATAVIHYPLNLLYTCQVNNLPDGRYAHPLICQRFLQCNSNITSIINCPFGLVFNTVSKLCDHVIHVPRCQPQTTTLTTPSTTTSTTTTTPTTTTTTTTTTAKQFSYSQYCKDLNLPNGLYYDPWNCHYFIECANQLTYHMACGPGTAFDEVQQVCVAQAQVDCSHINVG